MDSIHGVDTLRYVVVLYRLSTSNHNHIWLLRWPVQIVLYRLSTSNHNYVNSIVSIPEIVLYRLSTSNHNNRLSSYFRKPLSYIVFLHQTTTVLRVLLTPLLLSYIVFLHQTTTFESNTLTATNCLISSFYIKPQLPCLHTKWQSIVLYRLSTSNHNYSIENLAIERIVLYRLSTSNHNSRSHSLAKDILSYIVFLHQTTTVFCLAIVAANCLISSFYIKPQLWGAKRNDSGIVLYRLSTSNHNDLCAVSEQQRIVLYRLSTSNHNSVVYTYITTRIVLYRLSTSNHNRCPYPWLLVPIVLYRLSTSNHNCLVTLPQ